MCNLESKFIKRKKKSLFNNSKHKKRPKNSKTKMLRNNTRSNTMMRLSTKTNRTSRKIKKSKMQQHKRQIMSNKRVRQMQTLKELNHKISIVVAEVVIGSVDHGVQVLVAVEIGVEIAVASITTTIMPLEEMISIEINKMSMMTSK